jgi:C4-dicarboxylate transporter DctM subunit
MVVGLIAVSLFKCSKIDPPAHDPVTWKEIWNTFIGAIWALLMPVIIIGGIYGGFFTPTESSAVASLYSIIVARFIYKKLSWKGLAESFVRSSIQSAMVFFVVGVSVSFSWLMTTSGIPVKLAGAILALTESKLVVLLLINIILLFLGCFMETTAIILLMTPLLLPVTAAYGIDVLTLGIIMVVNTSIGMVTPPVALNLYVAQAITGSSMTDITKELAPYFLVLVLVLLIITFTPGLCTILVG